MRSQHSPTVEKQPNLGFVPLALLAGLLVVCGGIVVSTVAFRAR
jgi:hypothetical protein